MPRMRREDSMSDFHRGCIATVLWVLAAAVAGWIYGTYLAPRWP